MRKLNLLIGILMSLIVYSCSNNDDDNVDQTLDNKTISMIKIKIYNFNEIDRYTTRVYENNKPKTDSFYNANHELTYYYDWIYNDGMLTKRKGYTEDGTLIYDFSIYYDNLNRINQTINSNNNSSIITTDFAYNTDNTITSVSENNGNLSTKTFYINPLGLIYRELNDVATLEVEYDGDNNVISFNGYRNYTYDNNNIPPDGFPVYEYYMFGNYKNNYIIYCNSLQSGAVNNEASTMPKFSTGYQSSSDNAVIDWILDDENYPITKQFYSNNQLIIDYEYLYNE